MKFLISLLILSFGSSQAYIVSEQCMRASGDKQVIVLGDIHEPVEQSRAHAQWLQNTCSMASSDTAFLIEDRAWEANYPPDGDTLHDFCFFTRKMKNSKAKVCAADMRPKWMIWVALFAEDLEHAENRAKKAQRLNKELTPLYGTSPQVKEYKNQLYQAIKELEQKNKYTNQELESCLVELKKLEQELGKLLPQKNISMAQAILTSKKQDRLLEVCQRIDIKYADAWFIINAFEALQTHNRVVIYIGQGHTGSVCKALKNSLSQSRCLIRGTQIECPTTLPAPLDLTKCTWVQKPSLKLA